MFRSLNKFVLAAVLFAGGAMLLIAPAVLGNGAIAAGKLSSATIAVVMLLSALGIGYGSLDFWSRFAIGLGAWSLVAPVLFGFYESGIPFWSHMIAGFASLLVGVGGHELLERRKAGAGGAAEREASPAARQEAEGKEAATA